MFSRFRKLKNLIDRIREELAEINAKYQEYEEDLKKMDDAGNVALTTGAICDAILVVASILTIAVLIKRKKFMGLPWNVKLVLGFISIYSIFALTTIL